MELNCLQIAEVVEVAVWIPYIGNSSAHAGCKISSDRAENYSDSVGHVFAAVVAHAFDNGCRSRIADAESFADLSVYVDFARCGAVEECIAGYSVESRIEIRSTWRAYVDMSAGEAFANVVVGFALKGKGDAVGQKCAEALSGRSAECASGCVVGQACIALFFRYCSREHRTDRPVGVGDGKVEFDRHGMLDRRE